MNDKFYCKRRRIKNIDYVFENYVMYVWFIMVLKYMVAAAEVTVVVAVAVVAPAAGGPVRIT